MSIAQISLPTKYWSRLQFENSPNTTVFALWNSFCQPQSQTDNVLTQPNKAVVVLETDMAFSCEKFFSSVKIKKIEISKDIGKLCEILIEANDARQCGGVGRAEEFSGIIDHNDKFATIDGPLIRSKYCSGFVVGKEICLTCKQTRKRLINKRSMVKRHKNQKPQQRMKKKKIPEQK
ncbi:hypothetical protein JTE90_010791 [Oedothorax gibbosus]|uniref:Uncharacterized protein n=1 Tax=Oedothorax gibbosus TaxID=931172 RepID=A0AAV6VG65_9ARAC|nr:hypothetical protein JTE90_010791 [Oedothorax gibbosus]